MSETIFEQLRAEHDKARTLMQIIERTHGDSRGRRELFERLKTELKEHAKAEERSLYRPCLAHDMVQPRARHGIAEHEQIDELLEELETRDFDDPHWLPRFRVLQEKLEHHMKEEEHQFFQLAGRALSDDQKRSAKRTHVELRADA